MDGGEVMYLLSQVIQHDDAQKVSDESCCHSTPQYELGRHAGGHDIRQVKWHSRNTRWVVS